MRNVLVSASFAALVFGATPGQAATLELEPSSEWRQREYVDKCRMARTFGAGKDRVSLWLEKAGAGRFVNITAIGRPFRNPYGQRVSLAIRPGEPLSRGFTSRVSSSGRPAIILFGVQLISYEPETNNSEGADGDEETIDLTTPGPQTASAQVLGKRFDAVKAIELSGALVQEVSLKTGGLAAVMEQLERCAVEVVSNPERIASSGDDVSETPKDRNTIEWARKIQTNYPAYLLREMAQGSVGVRVQINPEGRATFCEVTQHSGPAGFNNAACLGMLRHSRFHPATDQDGNPIWGTYSTRITYRLN